MLFTTTVPQFRHKTLFVSLSMKIFLFISFKFCKRLSIDVCSVLFGEEEIVIRPGWRGRSNHTSKPRVTNRRGRKSFLYIGIPGAIGSNFGSHILKGFPITCCTRLRITSILDCGISIEQTHSFSIWSVNTIPIDTCYKGSIFVKMTSRSIIEARMTIWYNDI